MAVVTLNELSLHPLIGAWTWQGSPFPLPGLVKAEDGWLEATARETVSRCSVELSWLCSVSASLFSPTTSSAIAVLSLCLRQLLPVECFKKLTIQNHLNLLLSEQNSL